MRRKYKKPLTCPVCNKKFSYSAKQHPLGRLSKHLNKKHPNYKRKPTRRRATKIDELEAFDDIVAQYMLQPQQVVKPTQDIQELIQTPTPVQHQTLAGAILTGIKIGSQIASAYNTTKKVVKTGKKVVRKVNKRKTRKTTRK